VGSEPGFERLSSTSSSTISASTRRGSMHRTVTSGVWRRLRPAKDVPPNDDDDEAKVPVSELAAERMGLGTKSKSTIAGCRVPLEHQLGP